MRRVFASEVSPARSEWVVRQTGEAPLARFATFEAAERRARWQAVRQEVRGAPAQVAILAADGSVTGCWRGERFVPLAALEAAA